MDVRIEKLVYGGEGLAHHEGQTVFVPFVLPEELVQVRPIERKKKFVRGRAEQVLAASPQRVPAPCPYFGTCGGCHYQHIPYNAQIEYKVQILRETLARLGRIEWPGPIHTHPSPPFGYRNRAQWTVGSAGSHGAAAIGYHQAASSALCPVEQCPIVSPHLAETLARLRELLKQGGPLAGLTGVEAFADSSDTQLLLNIAFDRLPAAPAGVAQTLREALPGAETILLHDSSRDRYELFGPGYIHYQVSSGSYRVGHLSFFQVNRFLTEELLGSVLDDERGSLALDLFAGVGLFALPLAERFERVVAVEANPAAARDLEANLQPAGTTAEARNTDAAAFLAGWKDRPELVVLDPPRAGIAPAALTRLIALGPQRITYLSCDPATLARDLATLAGSSAKPGAYEIREMRLFDVFPQTYHIESLVRLVRRG